MKVDPPPSMLSADRVPPWRSTIALEMARPSPTPGIAAFRAADVRKNFEKMPAISSLDIPVP